MPDKNAKPHSLKAVPDLVAIPGDFEPESDECSKCHGIGMEIVRGKGARICACRKTGSEKNQFEGRGLPPRYDGFHFRNYVPRTPSQKLALEYALNLTNAYPAVDRGLLFSGSVGIGKTHLAVSILKGLLERGFSSCLFYDFATLLKEIQDSYNANTQTSELGLLAPVLKAEVLVLDELGSSKPTDWVRDTMSHVINTRYNNKKLTIFTTNYLDVRPADGKEILEDRIGVRLRSRLYEMCMTVAMQGSDYRRDRDRSLAAKK